MMSLSIWQIPSILGAGVPNHTLSTILPFKLCGYIYLSLSLFSSSTISLSLPVPFLSLVRRFLSLFASKVQTMDMLSQLNLENLLARVNVKGQCCSVLSIFSA